LVLMGKQAPGKRMPGVRNGPGGKCEPGEEPIDCAVREVREEIGVELNKEDLKYIGTLIDGEDHVYFYTSVLKEKIVIHDNAETVDCRWFNIERTDEYVHEMLPGDEKIIREVITSIKNPEQFNEFKLDTSDLDETTRAKLKEMTKHIHGFPKIK